MFSPTRVGSAWMDFFDLLPGIVRFADVCRSGSCFLVHHVYLCFLAVLKIILVIIFEAPLPVTVHIQKTSFRTYLMLCRYRIWNVIAALSLSVFLFRSAAQEWRTAPGWAMRTSRWVPGAAARSLLFPFGGASGCFPHCPCRTRQRTAMTANSIDGH